MEITVVSLPGGRSAAAMHVGPFQDLGRTFQVVGTWAQAHLSDLTGPPRVIYHDDPQATPPEELRSFVAVPVSEDAVIDESAGVQEYTLPAGSYATTAHVGPYTRLASTWEQFMVRTGAGGLPLDPSRPFFEVYISDPDATPEAELATELFLPVV